MEQSFASESGFFKHANRAVVAGNTCCLQPVQPERIEAVIYHQPECFDHEAPAGEAFTHPVADAGRLGGSLSDIAYRNAASQPTRRILEDEEGDAASIGEVRAVAPQPVS